MRREVSHVIYQQKIDRKLFIKKIFPNYRQRFGPVAICHRSMRVHSAPLKERGRESATVIFLKRTKESSENSVYFGTKSFLDIVQNLRTGLFISKTRRLLFLNHFYQSQFQTQLETSIITCSKPMLQKNIRLSLTNMIFEKMSTKNISFQKKLGLILINLPKSHKKNGI